MNGTSKRTQRTALCRAAHRERPNFNYKQIVAKAKSLALYGQSASDKETLIRALETGQEW